MDVLILGGTSFLGRHAAERFLKRGHTVSLFSRGETPNPFSGEVEHLLGDRDGGLSALENRKWDVVLDTSGYLPRVVGDSVELLSSAVEHYLFVSSVSAYGDLSKPLDEQAEVARLEEATEEIDGDTYGALKAECEEVVLGAMAGRATVVRPGLIVGPFDPTDRFTYWPSRVASGGTILAPDKAEHPVQLIDARDLANWIVDLLERRVSGTFNATGPANQLTMGEFLDECAAVTGSQPEFMWAPEEFLLAHELGPFQDLPLWVPRADAGITQVSSELALRNGLELRPVAETIRDTWEWQQSRHVQDLQAGLTREREAELLLLLESAA